MIAANAATIVANEAKETANAATIVANEAKETVNPAITVANKAIETANAAIVLAMEARDKGAENWNVIKEGFKEIAQSRSENCPPQVKMFFYV